MNFEDLYTVKTKLEEIYLKLEEINDNKFDSSEIKKAFKMVDSLLERYDEVPNSISGGTQVKTQNKEISNLLKLTDSLEEYVDKLYKSFRIFSDIKTIQDLYNKKKPTKEEFNECLKVILNDLIDYKFLITQGYFTTDRFNTELAPTLYKLILDEAKFNGTYTILNTLENMNVDTSGIQVLLNKDVANLLDNDDIKKRVNELDSKPFKNTKIDRKTILLISIYNDNYKMELQKLFKDKLDSVMHAKDDYDWYLVLKSKAEKENKEAKKNLKKAYKKLRQQIVPIILSASILLGANTLLGAFTSNYKHKTGTSYNTIEGYTNYEEYDANDTKVGDVVVEVYGAKRDNGERSYKRYVIRDQDNLEIDPENIDLSDKYLVTKVNNSTEDAISDEAYTSVSKIEKIDRDISVYLLMGLLHLLITMAWWMSDMFISTVTGIGFTGIITPSEDNYYYLKKGIDKATREIRFAKSKLYELEDGTVYSKDELIKKKEYLEKLINEYNKLLDEYSYLTETLNIEKKLKL